MKPNVSTVITNQSQTSTNNIGRRVHLLETFPMPEKGPESMVTIKRAKNKKVLTIIYLMNHSKKARIRRKNYKKFIKKCSIPFYNNVDGSVTVAKNKRFKY